MTKIKTICFFTGTRAEYGLLKPVMQKILAETDMVLKMIVSGAHLSETSGMTVAEIVADGFHIDEHVEILLDSNTDEGVATSIGLGVMRYAQSFKRLNPDAVVILGDRFEAIAAAIAATVCKIPIIHIHGGELTLGAMDDAFRHAITKMSHLHFTSTEVYRKRVIQLGENPSCVFNVGALGVENALKLPLLERPIVEQHLNIEAGCPYFLVTFHPVTLDEKNSSHQLNELITALDAFPEYKIIFTGANADAGGTNLNRLLYNYAQSQSKRCRYFVSLGATLYLSSVRDAKVVIGNSSSGIIEVPSFGVPTVDIGTRQLGRIRSKSVINCGITAAEIKAAIFEAVSPSFISRAIVATNPYGQANTAAQIVETLASWSTTCILHKNFYDITVE